MNVCSRSSLFAVHMDRAHGVDVEPSIFLDQYGYITLEWNPSNILPIVDESSFTVSAVIYWLGEQGGVPQWIRHSGPLDTGLPNNGRANNLAIPLFGDKKDIVPMCIEVVFGMTNKSATDEDRDILERISQAHFPVQPGVWTGLLFSTLVNRRQPQRSREGKLETKCTEWQQDKTEDIAEEVITSLLPCPPTRDRATLANSGLVEEKKNSLLFQTNYHNQWLEQFHSLAAQCYVQSGVER